MAISKVEFTEKVDTNLKANKAFERFYINFKKEGKRKERILDYSTKMWDKRTRVSKAKSELLLMKEQTSSIGINIHENSTLNQIADTYFLTREEGNWKVELTRTYRLHIKEIIGKKRIKDIKRVHLDKIVTSMRKKGSSKQTVNGCSPRTIKKALSETLKPILQYAIDNEIIHKLPIFPDIKLNRKKKTVKNAVETFTKLYKTINKFYKDDPFYLSLFLFIFFGRRWNEVRTLEWTDIDFNNNTYTIRAENNKINEDQTYALPPVIKTSLNEILDNNKGLVFKSPLTGKELHPPKNHIAKIREDSGVKELTLHYFRHIIASVLSDVGMAGTVLSASLGHTNMNTVDGYYRTANHKIASNEANTAINRLLESKVNT